MNAPQPDTYEPETWTPLDDEHVAHAKHRIAQIRADLRGECA